MAAAEPQGTGRLEDEIALSPAGRPMLTQHVNAYSPQTLAPETWYFVAATLKKVSSRNRALKLYVNGVAVAETVTEETMSYPTDKMGMTIGAVDTGEWQNFDGLTDEVRVYRRALSAPRYGISTRSPANKPAGRKHREQLLIETHARKPE